MVGLFFGSFDPVHWGHLIIADILRREQNFKEVIFIPSPLSPFKVKTKPHTPRNNPLRNHFSARVDMLERALADWEGSSVCDIEKTLSLPSYTYQTLRKLNQLKRYKKAAILMGEDNFILLSQWKESQWISRHFPICVYKRYSATLGPIVPHSRTSVAYSPPIISNPAQPHQTPPQNNTPEPKPSYRMLETRTPTPFLNFSSYEIRSRILHRQPIEHLVPKAVRLYIEKHPSLYT